jgi:hypothetical protein
VALTGGDFERNYPRIAKERRMMQKIGMWQPVPQEKVKEPQGQVDDDEEEEE